MNRAIREAAESFNDPKIQYIDINPAFNDHRFCEKGHSMWDQLNWSNKAHLWSKMVGHYQEGERRENV